MAEENKNNEDLGFDGDASAEAKTPDEIDGNAYDYEKKYRDTYAHNDFGADRVNDKYGEYNTDKSYADMSNSEQQIWHGTRTGGWTSFFRSLPYPMICVVVYLILGFTVKANNGLSGWHPGWVIFLTIPAYYSIVEYYATSGKVRFPLFSIVVITYLLMGFLGNLWHPGWVVFFAWPLYFVFDNLMKIKQTRLIIYTFVCIAIYVIIGLSLKLWHPTWIIFLTIPIFESLYVSAARLIKEKKGEHVDKNGVKKVKVKFKKSADDADAADKDAK